MNKVPCTPILARTFVSPANVSRVFPDIFGSKKGELSEIQVSAIVRDFIHKGNFDRVLYTDGSRKDNSTAFAVVSSSGPIVQGNFGQFMSVLTAESVAIWEAVQLTALSPDLKCLIVSDSRGAIDSLYHRTKRKNEIINRTLNNMPNNTSFLWVPSHMGITGNELADRAADEKYIFFFFKFIAPLLQHREK